MRAWYVLWRRELAAFFLAPMAYVLMFFFLLFMGFSFWFLVDMLAGGIVSAGIMRILFGESLFFWIAMLMTAPVITMRAFAEEKRSGAIETLLTAPVSDTAIVMAKYAAAVTVFIAMWLPTLAYGYVLRHFDAAMTVDLVPLLTGYCGAFLIGGFFIAIGIFASVLTRNQVVAAIICFVLNSLFFFLGFVPFLTRSETVRDLVAYVSAVMHMMDFAQGIVDTQPLVFYTSGIVFVLFLAIKALESRNWK